MSPARARGAMDAAKDVYVPDRASWRRWLARHHGQAEGVWLVFDKASAGRERLAYADAVEEALCFGWIDSTIRAIDAARYKQFFAPRKPKSTWSRVNKLRVERLTSEGLMMPAGLAKVEAAKANGAWTSIDGVEALEVPADLARALRQVPGAARNFAALATSQRKGYLSWVNSAKRPETRATRVAEVVRCAALNVRYRQDAPPRERRG